MFREVFFALDFAKFDITKRFPLISQALIENNRRTLNYFRDRFLNVQVHYATLDDMSDLTYCGENSENMAMAGNV